MEAVMSDRQPERAAKPRRAWIAGVANLVAPPLGHVYAGKPARGVVLGLVMTLVGIGALSLLTLAPIGVMTVVLMVLFVLAIYGVLIVDSVIVAKQWGKGYRLKSYNRWYVYLLVLLSAAALGEAIKAATRAYLVRAYRIPSGAMIPALLVGDHILNDKVTYRWRLPQRLEVVVFEFPEDPDKEFVKRIIALPGEIIEIREKKVSINGVELVEQYVGSSETDRDKPIPIVGSFGPFRVPDHSYFVLGDDRQFSYDSRFWGPVHRDRIRGLVRLIYFSWDPEKSAVRWDRIGEIVSR